MVAVQSRIHVSGRLRGVTMIEVTIIGTLALLTMFLLLYNKDQ